MIFWDIEQNTPEWYMARSGIPTASAFGRILTKTGKISSQARKYANECVAEIYMGKPILQEFSSFAMQWGNEHEKDAISSYEFMTECNIKSGGFFTNDAITYGASPDVRVYENNKLVGVAEIKCPQESTHIEYVLMEGKINDVYVPQVQGHMLVTGVDWVDWFSYHPDLPPALVRTYRDEKYISLLEEQLQEFDHLVSGGIEILKAKGYDIEKPIRSVDLLKKKHFDSSSSLELQKPA